MLFRTVLMPFIKVFQWSGLTPFSLSAEKPKSFWRSEQFHFAAITALNLMINLFGGIRNLKRIYHNHQPKEGHPKVVAYTHLLVGFIMRTNAITVLVESWANRSTQKKLLSTFDEIQIIFTEKLYLEIEDCSLRARFVKLMIFGIVKNVTLAALILTGLIFAFKWYTLYVWILMCVPFYTSALFYAQWMVYVDTIRFNIGRVNECLIRMSEEEGNGDFLIRTIDAFERLAYLRKSFSKIWQASILINRCFRWSLFIGNSTDLYFMVINFYWIIYSMVNFDFSSWSDNIFFSTLACLILMNFLVICMICEDISTTVSPFLHPTEMKIPDYCQFHQILHRAYVLHSLK